MILAGGGALWVGGKFFYKLHHYFLLSKEAPVVINEWTVLELKPGKFSVGATYQFKVGERTLHGVYHFAKPIYPNPYLAEDLIEEWQEEPWVIWHSQKNPTFAALEKGAPVKEGIQLALCISVFLYFLVLEGVVSRWSIKKNLL